MTIDEFIKALKQVNGNLPNIVTVHLCKIAEELKEELKQLWPEATGKSKAAFDIEVKDALTVLITNSTEYAEHVHYAGQKTPIKEQFEKYMLRKQKDIEKKLADAIEAEIRDQIDEALL